MPEPQSLEEAFATLFAKFGRPAREEAARNLALAVMREAEKAAMEGFAAAVWGDWSNHPLFELRARIAALREV